MSKGRRQPSCDGTSRMTRECQVRFFEGLGVKLPGPTRQERSSVVACAFESLVIVGTLASLIGLIVPISFVHRHMEPVPAPTESQSSSRRKRRLPHVYAQVLSHEGS